MHMHDDDVAGSADGDDVGCLCSMFKQCSISMLLFKFKAFALRRSTSTTSSSCMFAYMYVARSSSSRYVMHIGACFYFLLLPRLDIQHNVVIVSCNIFNVVVVVVVVAGSYSVLPMFYI